MQYAQVKMAEMNEKLWQGTNYVSTKANEVKDVVSTRATEVKDTVISKVPIMNTMQAQQPASANGQEEQIISNANAPEECQVTDQCQNTYTTNMYIPKKALQASGKVIVSAKEIVFSYTKVCNFLLHRFVIKLQKKSRISPSTTRYAIFCYIVFFITL